MSDEPTEAVDRGIDVAKVHEALNLVVFSQGPSFVESHPVICDWPKLCGEQGCKLPTYQRRGEPVGLVAKVLIQLGYPTSLLQDLDREHRVGEVIHPGIRIGESGNPALLRINRKAMALLTYLQDHQRTGMSWGELSVTAFGPKKLLRFLDEKRRPWRY